ncbi:glycoside hydrolase family 19 protein [Cupriavidus pauculus]|uniref:glycoside hydrolase family 19 protein n=1 Tax=Cupriavidus pauculus TaxID=82633 RepID=UPI001D0CD47B|nr:glycoside hydrolase family 19 protein [Cupriavidus pauculus]
MNVSATQLQRIMPMAQAARVADFVAPLNAAMREFGITTEQRIEMFLAQFAHESSQLRAMVENLNYSAQGLANTWARFSASGKRGGAPNALAQSLARNPVAIANVVYADRMGNGGQGSGDGWRYRGRAGFMITGLHNYSACLMALGIDCVERPELLEQTDNACRASAWFWYAHGLNEVADKGDFKRTTAIINGGDIGAAERIGLWQVAEKVIA